MLILQYKITVYFRFVIYTLWNRGTIYNHAIKELTSQLFSPYFQQYYGFLDILITAYVSILIWTNLNSFSYTKQEVIGVIAKPNEA